MAASSDISSTKPASSSTNPCCYSLMKKYTKLMEGRNALKESIEILERAYKVKESELREESNVRIQLEMENKDLKVQLSSYQQAQCAREEGEGEVERLKMLLQEEQQRSNYEKSRAEAEAKKTKESLRSVQAEKRKADEERSRAEAEKRKATQFMLQMEKLKAEIEEVNKRSQQQKKETDEKAHADCLLQKFKEERERNDMLQILIGKSSPTGSQETTSSCIADEKINSLINCKADDVKLSKKKIKQSKKNEKRMTDVGKREENLFIMQRLDMMKQNLMQITSHFSISQNRVQQRAEGLNNQEKMQFDFSDTQECNLQNAAVYYDGSTRYYADFPISTGDLMNPQSSCAAGSIDTSFNNERIALGARQKDIFLAAATAQFRDNWNQAPYQSHSFVEVAAECSSKRKRVNCLQKDMYRNDLYLQIAAGGTSKMEQLPNTCENEYDPARLIAKAQASNSGGVSHAGMKFLDMDVDVEQENLHSGVEILPDFDTEKLMEDIIEGFTNSWPLDNFGGSNLDIDWNNLKLEAVPPFQQASLSCNAGRGFECFDEIRCYEGYVQHELPHECGHLHNIESFDDR